MTMLFLIKTLTFTCAFNNYNSTLTEAEEKFIHKINKIGFVSALGYFMDESTHLCSTFENIEQCNTGTKDIKKYFQSCQCEIKRSFSKIVETSDAIGYSKGGVIIYTRSTYGSSPIAKGTYITTWIKHGNRWIIKNDTYTLSAISIP